MTTVSETPTTPRECAKHGTYAAKIVEIAAGRTITSRCPGCMVAEAAKEMQRKASEQAAAQARRIESLFQRAGIPPRFTSRTFENYEASGEGQERALRIAKAYADQFSDMRERGTCLVFSGAPGTGKTHLAAAIANQIMRAGHSALFTTVADALRSIKRSYGTGGDEHHAINDLVAPSLLILDEVGMAYDTDHSKTLIFDLMNKRYEQIRPSILLTNLDAAALREHLGDRITDRLREGGGKLVSFNWTSHRA